MLAKVEQPTVQEWDAFVTSHPGGHLLQTSAWGELKSAFGWQVERIAIREGEALAAGAQILFRCLPLGWTIAYVPKGPVIDWSCAELGQALLSELKRAGRARRAILLKLEPDLNEPPNWLSPVCSGFRVSRQNIQPRRTILVDIAPGQDEILAHMKSKTRYNIRLAERKGVYIREGGREDLADFVRLMAVTGERDDFGIHSPAYYERAYDLLAPSGMAGLFIATYEGQPLAGLMAFAAGQQAVYMFGASGNEHRDKMPTYALQWAAMCWARSRGCHTYDLWGVPDEEEETLEAQFESRHDGLWGVYRFKRGFGGRLVRYMQALDYIYNEPLYKLYQVAYQLRTRGVSL